MTPSLMKPSTAKLSEVTRHLVMPTSVASSGWAPVEARCAEFGDEFDEWQRGAGRVILGKRANGEYAATIGGITLSIPRQVAKTFLVSRIIFALCTLFPGLQVVWTAHRTRTATKTFTSMRLFAGRKTVAPYVLSIRSTNGEQEIRFRNGSAIMFGAREQGFGRGFDEIDIEVFDEAQILTEKALEDMVAATNQSRFPAGALLFYMGTPPRPVDPGEAFTSRRHEALAIQAALVAGEPVDADAVYIECSADPDSDPDDREQWAKANPSYPHRTPLRSMLRLRKNLVSDAAWMREALGIWDEDRATNRAISGDQWRDLGIEKDAVVAEGVKACAVAFSKDGMRMSLAAAVRGEESTHLELIDAYVGAIEGGLSPLAGWFVEKNDEGVPRWKRYDSIVLSGRAGAALLKQLLVERGVREKKIHVLTTPQVFAASAMLADSISDESVSHLSSGQDTLDESISLVEKQYRGNEGAWSWFSPAGDETPVEAVSFALYGARTSKARERGQRRSVIL